MFWHSLRGPWGEGRTCRRWGSASESLSGRGHGAERRAAEPCGEVERRERLVSTSEFFHRFSRSTPLAHLPFVDSFRDSTQHIDTKMIWIGVCGIRNIRMKCGPFRGPRYGTWCKQRLERVGALRCVSERGNRTRPSVIVGSAALWQRGGRRGARRKPRDNIASWPQWSHRVREIQLRILLTHVSASRVLLSRTRSSQRTR